MHASTAPDNGRGSRHRFSHVPLALLALVVGVTAIVLAWSLGSDRSFSRGVDGSGISAVQTRALPSFTSIDLAGSSTVNVHVGSPQSVVVHADDNLLELVKTEVRDGQLVIAEKGRLSSTRSLEVDVTVPRLSRATLSGSGLVDVSGARARRFVARVSGNGVLRVTGSVENLNATLSGSGTMRLGDLAARDVTATVAGSGRILVNAGRTLDALVPGSGVIVYGGRPSNVRQDVSGSGAVLEG